MVVPIEVRWLDHWFDDKEVEVADLKKVKPMEHTTHGILAFENRRMLVVCQTSLEDGRFSECVYIIKKLVTYRSDKEGTK